ncbi:YvrJ family protein [Clostridium sp.]|uniref:YvrJ family protein n=1 Tax=Clostridium sp. TaxID=1506 RepID=UPI002FCB1658
MEESLVNLISNVGFPIVMCGYFIFRFENKLVDLNKSIVNLTVIIAKMGNVAVDIDENKDSKKEETKIWQLK